MVFSSGKELDGRVPSLILSRGYPQVLDGSFSEVSTLKLANKDPFESPRRDQEDTYHCADLIRSRIEISIFNQNDEHVSKILNDSSKNASLANNIFSTAKAIVNITSKQLLFLPKMHQIVRDLFSARKKNVPSLN